MICRVFTRFGAFALWTRSIVSLQCEPCFTRCKAECEAFLWSIKCHFLLMRVELIQCQCPNLYIIKNLVLGSFFVKCRFVTSQGSQWLLVVGWIKRITNNENVVCVISAIDVMGASMTEIKACGFTLRSTPHQFKLSVWRLGQKPQSRDFIIPQHHCGHVSPPVVSSSMSVWVSVFNVMIF